MANDLDYLMKGVKCIITDEENTIYSRRSVLRVGWWKALEHLFSTGRWDRMKAINKLVSKYKEDDPEGVTNYIMEIAKGMKVKRVDQFGRELAMRPRRAVINFMKRYPSERALLTRDPYIVAYHTLLTAEDRGVPFGEYIVNDALVENGMITGQLKLKMSENAREKLKDAEGMPNGGLKTSEDKLVLFDSLVERVFELPYENIIYLTDDGSTEKDIKKEHGDSILLAKDLEDLMPELDYDLII